MSVSPDAEFELRERQLAQDRELKLAELRLKEAEYRRSRWTNPLVVAVVAGAMAWYGQHLVREFTKAESRRAEEAARAQRERAELQANLQAAIDKKQFCHRVIADFLNRNRDGNSAKAANELKAVVSALSLETECDGNLWQIADLYSDPKAEPEVPSVAAAAPTAQPSGKCEDFESIKALGWASGHKTKFCQSRESKKFPGRKFTGVQNPFGDYKAGGYCYLGETQACLAEIQARVRR